MSRPWNAPMHLVVYASRFRNQLVVPRIFLPNSDSPTFLFTVKSQFGGPWDVLATRCQRTNRYWFNGEGWESFIDGSHLQSGNYVLFSLAGELMLDAVVVSESYPNPTQVAYDLLVRMKKRQGATAIDDAVGVHTWHFQLQSNMLSNFVIDGDFAQACNLADSGLIQLKILGTSHIVTGMYERIGGTWYLREGIKEVKLLTKTQLGDTICFFTYPDLEGNIAVDVSLRDISGLPRTPPHGRIRHRVHAASTSTRQVRMG